MEKDKVLPLRTEKYKYKELEYKIIDDTNIDMDFEPLAFRIVNGCVKLNLKFDKYTKHISVKLNVENFNSCYVDGRAGVGKSHLIGSIKKELDQNKLKYVCLAPTNKAARNINGMTIHKFVGKDCQKLSKIKKCVSRIDAIFIDEVSMLHELYYRVILAMKKAKPTLRIIMVGDYEQLEPVKDRVNNCDYKGSRALWEICDGNRVELTKCRRSDDILFNLCKNVENVKSDQFGKTFTMRNLAFSNKRRMEINDICMDISVKDQEYLLVKKYELDENSQDMKLTIGTPVIARKNCREYEICNNDTFSIVNISDTLIGLDSGGFIPIDEFAKLFHVAYCITVHRSQGMTINEPYSIYEWKKFDKRLKYVALSRSTLINNINIM